MGDGERSLLGRRGELRSNYRIGRWGVGRDAGPKARVGKHNQESLKQVLGEDLRRAEGESPAKCLQSARGHMHFDVLGLRWSNLCRNCSVGAAFHFECFSFTHVSMQVWKSSVGAVFYHVSFFSPVNMQVWMFFCGLYGKTCLRSA